MYIVDKIFIGEGGGIGRHDSLRDYWQKRRGGSNPFLRTKKSYNCLIIWANIKAHLYF